MTALPDEAGFAHTADVCIVGAGACGLIAALTARGDGADCLVLERDPVPAGSTALSSGMIPACGTEIQKARGIDDTVADLAADIQRKARGQADPALVDAVCRTSGPTVDWLGRDHGVRFELVDGFLYPGHGKLRMHAPPSRTGAELMGALLAAAERVHVDVVIHATVRDLLAGADGRVAGVVFERPDGTVEWLGCRTLILACNGSGGNREMVARYIPEMATADYFGHPGNQGDAVRWGQRLGAALRHMTAYQGHGSVATPHAILITWALVMEGGVQVNRDGLRFSNEHLGYSEQAVKVLAQPGGMAWLLFDQRLRELGRGFEDFRRAEAAGAVRTAADADALAGLIGVSAEGLAGTFAELDALAGGGARDRFGRDFTATPRLRPPYCAIKVTGALFHTQGGLAVSPQARVLRPDGRALANLFAGGGAACGVSGDDVAGYLSGNGLLTAAALGRIAGRQAARQARGGVRSLRPD